MDSEERHFFYNLALYFVPPRRVKVGFSSRQELGLRLVFWIRSCVHLRHNRFIDDCCNYLRGRIILFVMKLNFFVSNRDFHNADILGSKGLVSLLKPVFNE